MIMISKTLYSLKLVLGLEGTLPPSHNVTPWFGAYPQVGIDDDQNIFSIDHIND